jgi:hypothetical protein
MIAFVLQLFMFSCTLLKAVLFNFPFVILTYFALRRKGDIVGLGWLMCVVLVLGMLEIIILDQDNVTAVVTRRVLAIPAYLAYEYFDLFGKIGHVYWTDGLLGSWASYPFAYDPPRLVGQFAFENPNTWANNGMYGMGFMQAGFAGMLVYGGVWAVVIPYRLHRHRQASGRSGGEYGDCSDDARHDGRRYADESFDPRGHRCDPDAVAVGGHHDRGNTNAATGAEHASTRVEIELSNGEA